MFYIIDRSSEVLTIPDEYEFQTPYRHIFIKHYDVIGKSSIRIITENIKGVLEVKTIHCKKYKKLISRD